MLVGVDGRPANQISRVGIVTQCAELLRAMAKVKGGIRLRIYLDGPPVERFPLTEEQAEFCILPQTKAWTHRRLGPELRRNPPDVFLSTGIQVPLGIPCPVVVTIHDLACVTFPTYFPWKQRWAARCFTYLALRRAQAVLTDSQSTKNDVIRIYGIPEPRVTVTMLAAADRFVPQSESDIRTVRKKHNLSMPYVLYVGRLQPRKNLDRLIEAFGQFKQRHPEAPHILAIAGSKGWMYDGIYEAARRSPVRDAIRFLGAVPDEDLPAMMGGAEVLVLVSLWEGFGLPVIEAMACGTPVITSDCSSLPEVAGDAAILVDPYNVEAIAESLERVLLDPETQRRLKNLGLERAKYFTFEKAAVETIDVLRSVAGEVKRKA